MSASPQTSPARRLPFLLDALLALVLGLWAGLFRIGYWRLFPPVPMESHGPLMLSGFLGALLSLERAVALRRGWAYFAPLACAAGVVGTLVGWPWAPWLFTFASGVAVAAALVVLGIDRSLHLGVMALGAVCWLYGNLAWALGRPVSAVVAAWAAFLVLTIVGERLELNRLLRPTRSVRAAFLVAVGLLLAGLGLGAASPQAGMRLFGAGLLALAAWLFRHDFARRAVRQTGLVRFIGATLLGGYGWLALAGALAVRFGNPISGPLYDALLHSLFVGFVFLAIFAHAPVILPAVLHVRLDYRPRFYAHVALLHASLLVRIAGDLTGSFAVRRLGGLLNVTAIALFLVSSAMAGPLRRRSTRLAGFPTLPAASARRGEPSRR
jgi:hypothetical protein